MIETLVYIEIETAPWLETSPPGEPVTWRFATPTRSLPRAIEAIPSIVSIDFQPAIISLGDNLGQRATLRVRLRDHRHRFATDDFDTGTFFGKWRGRYGTRLRGRPLRWITGEVGDALDDMTTWHFVIESVDGPTPDGLYTIVAQDVLKLADSDRALYPRPCDGFLIGDITSSATSATLAPSGIGALQYAASGFLAIGGKEVCAFTRSGDTLTLTRAATIPGTTYETEVVEHKAGSRVQMCELVDGEDAADILFDILATGAGVPTSYMDLATWQAETTAHLGTIYTTLICEPTGVATLASELIAQAALSVWWDAEAQEIKIRALRNVTTDATAITESEMLEGTLATQEQPATRVSEVLTYFGLRNPLKPLTDPDNYRSALLGVDLEAEDAYGGLANRTIFSRWIPFGGGTIANRLNNLLIGRFRDPPRRLSFDLARTGPRVPALGGAYRVGWRANQDATGAEVTAPVQLVRLGRADDRYTVEAEEMLVTVISSDVLSERTIIVDALINNINLRTLHDAIYPEIVDPYGLTVRCIINPGVSVGSSSTATPAVRTGSWVAGTVIVIENNGTIQGAAGAGGAGGTGGGAGINGSAGAAGGRALLVEVPVSVINAGNIWGGSGGGGGGGGGYVRADDPPPSISYGYMYGGGGGGGGGAGRVSGGGGVGGYGLGKGDFLNGTTAGPAIGATGSSGSAGAGGAGGGGADMTHFYSSYLTPGDGGAGGNPGGAGSAGAVAVGSVGTGHVAGSETLLGAGGAGGAAGAAIDGVSNVSMTNTGSILGPQIN